MCLGSARYRVRSLPSLQAQRRKTTYVELVQDVRSCRRARLSPPARGCCSALLTGDPARWRPASEAGCRRCELRAASCTLHAQHNSLTTRPKNAPPSFNEGMHSRAGLAHWQARPLAVSSRSWQCALCDVLMCCWMAWELTCKITASLAKCRFCPCYPLPR
jgi:hypothetical protein